MKQVDVAIAVVVRGAQILICRRPDGVPFSGYWEFPGGKLEAGETLEQCIVREMREETGCEIWPQTELARIDHEYPQARVRLHAFVCRLVNGEPRAIQCTDCRWIDLSDLRQVQFPPANEALVEAILNRFTDTARTTPAG